jgi:hypothetical protein
MARETYEDVDEPGPDHLASGVVIMTTVLLLGAFFVMQKALKDHFNAGMMASKDTPAPAPAR